MDSLGNIIGKHFRNSPLKRNVEASMIVEEANKIIAGLLGDDAAKYARVVFVKDQDLTVACLSSVAAQEIRLHEPVILSKLTEKLGYQAISKIKYLT